MGTVASPSRGSSQLLTPGAECHEGIDWTDMSNCQRDHLFISYAWEDGEFAEWLTLKLTALGYKVWCDRFKLLGGESYPQDIDLAIKEQAFRVLGLLSKHSLNKANPLKERTLALNLGRERREAFLIPLNVDGLGPTELPWMLSDLSYISFHPSWATGLAQLLRKLNSIDAPRPLPNGNAIASQYLAERTSVCQKPERLWTNLLEIQDLPPTVLRITLAKPAPADVLSTWPHYRENDLVLWALEGPIDNTALDIDDVDAIAWIASWANNGPQPLDVVTALLREHLRRHCLDNGMKESADRKYLYFPPGLFSTNRLSYIGYDGQRTWVSAVGERSIRKSATELDRFRYHLAVAFGPALRRFGVPVVQVRTRVYLTDTAGIALRGRKVNLRRKRLCRDWWNHEWLGRLLGIAGWLADGTERITLTRTSSPSIVLASRPICLGAAVGIDESTLVPAPSVEDTDLDDDSLLPETYVDGADEEEEDIDG